MSSDELAECFAECLCECLAGICGGLIDEACSNHGGKNQQDEVPYQKRKAVTAVRITIPAEKNDPSSKKTSCGFEITKLDGTIKKIKYRNRLDGNQYQVVQKAFEKVSSMKHLFIHNMTVDTRVLQAILNNTAMSRLQELGFINSEITVDSKEFTDFLLRCPNLEVLNITGVFVGELITDESILIPRKEFHLNYESADGTSLKCPSITNDTLDHLRTNHGTKVLLGKNIMTGMTVEQVAKLINEVTSNKTPYKKSWSFGTFEANSESRRLFKERVSHLKTEEWKENGSTGIEITSDELICRLYFTITDDQR